jgi:mycothiol synthase
MSDPVPLKIVPLSQDRQPEALGLVLAGLPETQIAEQLAMLRTWVAKHPSAGYRVWGAYRGERLCGAVLLQLQPGRTAIIWPPRLIEGESPETAQRLVRQGLDDLPRPDVAMVQSLLPTDVGADAELLEWSGFRHISDLLFLVALPKDFPSSRPAREFQFEPYRAAQSARFARLVDATYEKTLDCPAVNGVRGIEDVLLGYQATGQFDPQRWFTVRHRGEDIGCLILTDYPELCTWELIYVGLRPESRGRGWGVEIVRYAQWLCQTATRNRLVLAVDAANEPALKMYAAAGFQSWDRKSVYVLVLD